MKKRKTPCFDSQLYSFESKEDPSSETLTEDVFLYSPSNVIPDIESRPVTIETQTVENQTGWCWLNPHKRSYNDCTTTRTVRIEDIETFVCGYLESSDIVLFHGTSLKSRAISFFTRSYWSHVGIVLKHPDLNNGRPCLVESLLEPGYDLVTKKTKSGVRVCDAVARFHECASQKLLIRKFAINCCYHSFSCIEYLSDIQFDERSDKTVGLYYKSGFDPRKPVLKNPIQNSYRTTNQIEPLVPFTSTTKKKRLEFVSDCLLQASKQCLQAQYDNNLIDFCSSSKNDFFRLFCLDSMARKDRLFCSALVYDLLKAIEFIEPRCSLSSIEVQPCDYDTCGDLPWNKRMFRDGLVFESTFFVDLL